MKQSKISLVAEKATAPPTKESAPAKRDVVTRWGGDTRIVAKGFVGVPVLFLEQMAALKPHALTPAEALFVICVMAFKWDERRPYPSYKRIATWMGKSESYARRLAQQLETKGMLTRVPRIGDTNAFEFEPLFKKLLVEDPSVGTAKPKRAAAGQAKPKKSRVS